MREEIERGFQATGSGEKCSVDSFRRFWEPVKVEGKFRPVQPNPLRNSAKREALSSQIFEWIRDGRSTKVEL